MAGPSSSALQILVVDDQEDVRRCLRDLLTALGHLVVTVPGGEEALAALDQSQSDFDCLMADVDLPAMSGPRLAEEATRRHPDLRVVLMSGHERAELEAEELLGSHQAFLPKPFRLHDLKGVIDVVRAWRSIA